MLNWVTRYAPVTTAIERLGGAQNLSILDVGSGSVGLACVLPDARFASCDVAYFEPVATNMVAMQVAPGRLPFDDAAFDVTICLDVIEHLPAGGRAQLISELGRVAAREALVACPTDEATWADDYVHEAYLRAGVSVPWLDEHMEHGLPNEADLDKIATTLDGFSVEPWPVVNGWLASMVAFGDVLPELAGRAATEVAESKEAWLALLQQAEFGSGPRWAVRIRRADVVPTRVAPGSPPDSVMAATRCICGAAFRLVDDRLARCEGCSATLRRDDWGVWQRADRRPEV